MISTKNLFIATIRLCVGVNYSSNTKYFSIEEFRQILVKKINKEILDTRYIDIFTKTVYHLDKYLGYSKGEWYITEVTPISTNKKFLTFNEATSIIEEVNGKPFSIKSKSLTKVHTN